VSEFEIPKIITADCSFPREIDDGLFVERMDEDHELYRVGVCVVDTSKLYVNEEIKKDAFKRTEAKYWDLPGNERGYDPMIEADVIKGIEFTAGNVRDALVITFLVGDRQEPTDVEASFSPVEVVANKSYKEFANFATYSPKGKRFSRASELIKNHLRFVAYGDHAGDRPQWRKDTEEQTPNLSNRAWKRGSKMNEAFMVGANHLIGKMLAEEGRPAIYRVHDPEDEQYLELLSANVARYSWTPGAHSGLGLDPYCRVTSPLRRLDDFVMNNQLKKRFLGKKPTAKDSEDVHFAVRRLNQEIIANAPKEVSRMSRRDILGRVAVGKFVFEEQETVA
jgi:exoribonuclease II